MKALLVESKDEKRWAMIFLPSGKIEIDAGDPAGITVELDGDNLRVFILTADELALFKVEEARAVDVGSRLFIKALEYRNIRVEYEREKLEFKVSLLNEMVTPNCDALTFLDTGSVVL